MEQHISKHQDNGKTVSEPTVAVTPHWHLGPKDLPSREVLRRRFKKLYGYKPCGMTEKMLKQAIELAENRRAEATPRVGLATIGESLEK
jgi:hypothetical protein